MLLPTSPDPCSPVARAALAWLRAHQPPERDTPSLLWGDSRLGNLVFAHDLVPAGVLDWEMVTLGQPEIDLGWFLYLDRHLSEGIGVSRLPGLPSRDATIARYAALTGRVPVFPEYYEVFAGFRLMLITARLTKLIIAHGMVRPDADFPLSRNTTNLLAKTLKEYGREIVRS